MKNSRLLTIFVIVFVDLLGFGLILPLLPYYADSYGATPVIVGLLVASYAAAQLIGAPLLGRLSDRLGRRPVLLISLAGTFLGFLLLGFAAPLGQLLANWVAPQAVNTMILGVLFLSRILDGLTGGNISSPGLYCRCDRRSKPRQRFGADRCSLWVGLYHWTGGGWGAEPMGVQHTGICSCRCIIFKPCSHILPPA
jgi:DHA1 family tetracycline resistance protein-like MFS transporter